MEFSRLKNITFRYDYLIPSLIVFILIIYNNDTFRSINSSISTTSIIFIVLLFYSLVLLFFRKLKVNLILIIILLILTTILFMAMLFNNDFTGGYFMIIMNILIGFMLVHLISFHRVVLIFLNTMAGLALFSLLAIFILKPLFLNYILMIFPTFVNLSGITFIDLHLGVLINDINYDRNFGIFREPGVYQIFLNIALLLELFYSRNKVNLIRLLIIYITILTTFSTPGYIVCLLLLITYVLSKQNNYKEYGQGKVNLKLIVTIFIVIILTTTFYMYLTDIEIRLMFEETMNKLFLRESSYLGRSSAILASMTSGLESPLFGKGISEGLDINKIIQHLNLDYRTSHLTSTIGALFSSFGFIFTSLIVLSIYRLINLVDSSLNIFIKIVIFISFMILLNTQLLIYNELIYLFIMFGFLPKTDHSKGWKNERM